MNKPLTVWKPSWLVQLVARCQWAARAFLAHRADPVLEFANGTRLHLNSNTLVIPGSLHLHTQGRLMLTSSEDVIINSGNHMMGEGRLFLNCPLDAQGNPILEDVPELIEGTPHDHTAQ